MTSHDRFDKGIPRFHGVRHVLLDMDGTLLDRYFDDFFWEDLVPEHFGRLNRLTTDQARRELLARYRTHEGSLAWTDIEFWSGELALDIAGLKEDNKHLISMHPDVVGFLDFMKNQDLQIVLVTNAHPQVVALKLAETDLEPYLDRTVCSRQVGSPKEAPGFWQSLESLLGEDYRRRAVLFDDTEAVLESARSCGILCSVLRTHANSRRPGAPSQRFPSIETFREVMRPELWSPG